MIITPKLLDKILAGYALPLTGTHGISHWARVLENGRKVAALSGADLDVVELFAIFHDSRRLNEAWDHGHGRRGADLPASFAALILILMISASPSSNTPVRNIPPALRRPMSAFRPVGMPTAWTSSVSARALAPTGSAPRLPGSRTYLPGRTVERQRGKFPSLSGMNGGSTFPVACREFDALLRSVLVLSDRHLTDENTHID